MCTVISLDYLFGDGTLVIEVSSLYHLMFTSAVDSKECVSWILLHSVPVLSVFISSLSLSLSLSHTSTFSLSLPCFCILQMCILYTRTCFCKVAKLLQVWAHLYCMFIGMHYTGCTHASMHRGTRNAIFQKF